MMLNEPRISFEKLQGFIARGVFMIRNVSTLSEIPLWPMPVLIVKNKNFIKFIFYMNPAVFLPTCKQKTFQGFPYGNNIIISCAFYVKPYGVRCFVKNSAIMYN